MGETNQQFAALARFGMHAGVPVVQFGTAADVAKTHPVLFLAGIEPYAIVFYGEE